jgi:hypothetical protein
MENAFLAYMQDAAQGASNAFASNVSGPVDMLAWLLRKGGVPVPENAVGGSRWMAEKGLTAKPKNALAGLAGEAFGLSAPIAVAAKAPQIANALIRADEAMQPAVANAIEQYMVKQGLIQPATVWHGSPHKFDKFDASKIGTGEGAQAYGHGLYLADSPTVATGYKETLSQRVKDRLTIDGKVVDPDSMLGRAAEDVPRIGLQATLQKIDDNIKFNDKYAPDMAEMYRGVRAQIASLDPSRVAVKEGQLYKVDLPDELIAKMLDWDKPLSQQAPEVRAGLQNMVSDVANSPNASRANRDLSRAFNPYSRADLLEEISQRYGWKIQNNTLVKADGSIVPESAIEAQLKMRQRGKVYDTAGDLYNDLSQVQGNQASISATLRNNGIPGIRYLDGGSRGAGYGTSNYVVFPGNENMLSILERNGAPIGK